LVEKKKKVGQLYGIGLGPGDPELVTLKAHRILSRVSSVFVPQKSTEHRSYAGSIVSRLSGNPGQKIANLVFPMQKDGLEPYWERAAEEIWQHLARGEDCAFVTEGDPLLYGTFIYILAIFQERHPEVEIEIIPGVSSISAAAAGALFPLASGGGRVAILPAVYGDNDLRKTLESFDTVVLLKANHMFDSILDTLEEMGLTDNCVYVKKCSMAEEEIVKDIRRLRGQKLDYFSLLIVRRGE
jgi:precorrin-2/cobalt-factor-2 C20-methyltransferase